MIVKAILVYSGLLYFLKPVRSAAFIEWCEEATERRRFTLDKCSQYPFVYPYPDCYCLNGIALVKVAHDSRPIREINFGKNGCFSHKALGASNRTIELLPVEFAENDTLVGYEKAGSQTSFEFVKVPSGATPQEFPNNTLVIYNGELFDTNEDYNDKPLYCIQKNSNQDTAQQVRYYQLFPETYIWLNETCDGGNYVDLELISAGRLLTEGNQKCVPKCGKYDANAPIRVPTRKSGFVDYSNSEEFGLEKSCKPVPNHLRDVHKDLNERILKHSIERAFYDQQSYKVDYKPSYSFKIMELLSKITSKYCRHARIPNNFLEQALDYFKVAHEGRGFYFSEDFSFADYNSISRMLRRCLFYMNQTIQFTSEGCGSGHNIISVFRDSPKVDAKVVHSTATHQYFDHHVVLDIPWNMLDLANVVCVNAFSKSYRMYHLMEQGIEKLFTNELRSFWLYPDVPNFYYENLYGPYWRSVARNLEKCVDSAYMYNPKMARLIRPQWIPGNQRSSRRRGTIVDPICERRRSDLELISQNYEIYCASPGKESGGSGDADKLANMTIIDWPDASGTENGGYAGSKPLIDFPDYTGGNAGGYTGNKPLIDFPDNSGDSGQGSYTGNKPLIDFPDNSGGAGQGSYTGNKPLIDFPDNSGDSGQGSYTGNKPLIDFPDNSGGSGQSSYTGNKPLIDFPDNSGGAGQGSYAGNKPLIDFPENSGGSTQGSYTGNNPLIDFPENNNGGVPGGQNGIDYKGSKPLIDFPTSGAGGSTGNVFIDFPKTNQVPGETSTNPEDKNNNNAPDLNLDDISILDVLESSEATEHRIGGEGGQEEIPSLNFENFPILDDATEGDLGHQEGTAKSDSTPEKDGSAFDELPAMNFDNFPIMDVQEGGDGGGSAAEGPNNLENSTIDNDPAFSFDNFPVIDVPEDFESNGGGVDTGASGTRTDDTSGSSANKNGGIPVDGFENYNVVDFTNKDERGEGDAGSGGGSGGGESSGDNGGKQEQPDNKANEGDMSTSNGSVGRPTDTPKNEDNGQSGSAGSEDTKVPTTKHPPPEKESGNADSAGSNQIVKPPKPSKEDSQGEGSKPVDESVIGDGGKPIDDSVIGDGGKPIDDSVIGDGGKPIDDSVSGDGGKPIDDSVIGDGGNTISVTTEKTVSPEIGSEDNNGNDNYLDNLPALTFPEDTETGNGIGPGDTPSDPAPPDGSNAGGQDGSPRDGSSNEHVYIKWPDDAASGDQVYLKWPKEPGYPSNPEDPDQDQVYLKWPNEPGNPGDSDADRVYLKWPEEPSSFRNTQPGQRSVFVDDIDPITNNEEELPNDARAAIYKRYIHPNQQQVPNQNAYAFPREFSNPRGLYQDPADTPYVINDVGNEFSLDRYDTAEGVKPYRRSMEPYSQLGRAIPSGQPLGDSSDYLRWPEKGIDPSEAYLRWPQKRIDPNEAYLRWPEKRIDPNEAYLRWPQKGIEPDDYLKWPQLNPIQPNPGTGDPSTPPRSRPLLDFPDYDPVPAPEWPPKRKHSPPSNQPPKDPNNSDGKEASERQGRNVRDDVSITYTEDPRRSNQLHQRSTILRHPLSQELMPTISAPETASISYYRPLGNLQSKEYTPDNAKPQPRASGKSIKPLRPIEFQPKGNKMKVFKRESFKLNVTNSSTVDHSSYPRFPKNSLMLETYNPMNIHLKCPTQHSFSPMSNNCTHFYTCIPDSDAEDQLLMLLLKCRPSMHFDPKLQDCIPGDCLQLEFASPAPESLKVNYSAVKVQTGRAAEFNANCTSSKKMLPIPEDCRNYLVCSNIYGDWYVNKYECPQNTYFREFSGCVEGTCM